MSNLVKIKQSDSGNSSISSRELYEFLGINSNYTTWFNRMCEYGFTEGVDFEMCFPNMESGLNGGQNKIDHMISIDMAKEISMIQRTERGKQAREYFIAIEKEYNSPEKVMARALVEAHRILDVTKLELAQSKQIIVELQPKASYYDLILQNKSLVSISKIAKDYGKSGIWLNKTLESEGIQFSQGGVWLLYQKYAEQGYTQSTSHVIDGEHSRLLTKWTQKGRIFIYDTLKKKGVLPLIERGDI